MAASPVGDLPERLDAVRKAALTLRKRFARGTIMRMASQYRAVEDLIDAARALPTGAAVLEALEPAPAAPQPVRRGDVPRQTILDRAKAKGTG